MESDNNKADLPEQLQTERQAAGRPPPEKIAAEKRRAQAMEIQARIDRAAATPTSVNRHWMFGAAIALIPILVAMYFVLFWEPGREVQQDADASQPVGIESRDVLPARQEYLPPPPPALPPHLSGTESPESPVSGITSSDGKSPGIADQAIEDLGSPQTRKLPALDYSDDEVLDALSSLSPVLDWYIWLYTDEVVRKFVTAIDNLAAGKIANKSISIPKPAKAFKGTEVADKQFVDPATYERYNAYADIFEALDNDDLVAVYSYYFPLLEEAYLELGYPEDRRFHGTMIQSIDMILSAPVINGEIELVPRTSVLYKYADPSLESLPEVHKQLLRMGPRNTMIIQTKLGALKQALIR